MSDGFSCLLLSWVANESASGTLPGLSHKYPYKPSSISWKRLFWNITWEKSLALTLIIKSLGDIYRSTSGIKRGKPKPPTQIQKIVWPYCKMINLIEKDLKHVHDCIHSAPRFSSISLALFCKDLLHARCYAGSFISFPSHLSMERWQYVYITLQKKLNLPKAISQ